MVHKVVLKTLLGGPKGQNYFHNNTKIMFGFYAILIFTMMVQNKKSGYDCWSLNMHESRQQTLL